MVIIWLLYGYITVTVISELTKISPFIIDVPKKQTSSRIFHCLVWFEMRYLRYSKILIFVLHTRTHQLFYHHSQWFPERISTQLLMIYPMTEPKRANYINCIYWICTSIIAMLVIHYIHSWYHMTILQELADFEKNSATIFMVFMVKHGKTSGLPVTFP